MTEIIDLARQARTQLAQALAQLQQPGIPSSLQAVAEPVAGALSALHQVEAGGPSVATAQAPSALRHIQQALEMLQLVPDGSLQVDRVIQTVAASLGVAHQLNNAAQLSASAPATPFAAAPGEPAPPVQAAAPVNGGQLPRIDAALGAHSGTNFFKGLSGNDVVDSGGIFVETYTAPSIGANVMLHIAMPGGYEFEATATVQWLREGSVDAMPGFGARFTGISHDARQLVYRYVRNREPLFHDDL